MSFFAKQNAARELGLSPAVVHVGNPKSIRTRCDDRDATKAYGLLVNKCQPGGIYNIGATGQ